MYSDQNQEVLLWLSFIFLFQNVWSVRQCNVNEFFFTKSMSHKILSLVYRSYTGVGTMIFSHLRLQGLCYAYRKFEISYYKTSLIQLFGIQNKNKFIRSLRPVFRNFQKYEFYFVVSTFHTSQTRSET